MSNAIELGSTLAQLIPTLDLSKVPETLHCTQCQEFLLNPYKTSCCDSKLCEKCYENIPEHCPKCKHKPFSKDLCSVAKAARGTAKAYLRNVEKSQAEDRSKAKITDTTIVDDMPDNSGPTGNRSSNPHDENPSAGLLQTNVVVQQGSPAVDVQPSIEIPEDQAQDELSESSDDGDDEVEIQVEPSAEDEYHHQTHHSYLEDEDLVSGKHDTDLTSEDQDGSQGLSKDTESINQRMSNMGMNMNMNSNGNIDMNPMAMMQQMQQMMMMNGMNPLMGMPQGMNPGMFGGFAGQNGGMNGMNMGMMNFNSNQNMFGWNGQNSNSWQNNNGNSYSNGMGNDFSSQYGFDMSQQGNFQQQSFRNGDFQNGYPGYRGRGRGRGRGFNRGRGGFNQYSQNSYHGYQNAHEQQQSEIQQMQAQMMNNQTSDSGRGSPDVTNKKDKTEIAASQDPANVPRDNSQELSIDKTRDMKDAQDHSSTDEVVAADTAMSPQQESNEPADQKSNTENKDLQPTVITTEKPIPEAYHEDFDSMAPPSAPVGPSGRYGERDYGFRSRGHGRHPPRGRGSFSLQNSHPASPIRSVSQTSIVAPSSPAKGLGVQGAPTGPKAMREPSAPKPVPRSNPGLEIRGRASQQLHGNTIGGAEKQRSVSPSGGYDDRSDGRSSKRHEQPEARNSRYDDGSEAGYDRSDRDRDRRRKKSRRDDYEDEYEMQDADKSYSRSNSQDRKSSHRSSHYAKDRDQERSEKAPKHRSSRRHHNEDTNGDHDMDDYGDLAEDRTTKHRSSHKTSSKVASKHDERDDRREDRHRKRSRHDRDREEEYDEEEEDESRHRSRRHKKEHRSSSKRDRERGREKEKEKEKEVDDDMGLRISGRSSRKTPALPTPTSITAPSDIDKDPHTLEREARNKERMQKEQQRREKAAMDKVSGTQKRGTVSGGRRVSYKYEDEVERNMDERDNARWR